VIERRSKQASTGGRRQSGRPIALVLWYALMAIGGLAFGALGDRRPFGDNLLFHPLVMFMTAAGVGLIVLRIALARPVPEIIPDRKLAFGFLIGWAAFLAGNFLAMQLFGR
jgi:hypothetical protein